MKNKNSTADSSNSNSENLIASSEAYLNAVSDTGKASRVGLWVLSLGFGGFLLWATLAPLDEGIPTQGMVALDTKRKSVQHLSGGVIKQVLVREGDLVREGQPLIQLDEATARANYEAVRQRYLSYRAIQGRLQAEEQGARSVVFDPELVKAASDPEIKSQLDLQQQLFSSRRSSLMADLKIIEEGLLGQQALLDSYLGMLASRKTQLELLREELRNTKELVKDGYAPRNRQLELERLEAESESVITELHGTVARTQRSIQELRQRTISRQQEYRKEVEQQLADITREVQSDAEKYSAVKSDLDRTEIRATASGQVVGLVVQTVGGVVQAGQKLMDIVPENEPLLLEARIEPHLIDKVRAELETDVRFSSFAHSPQLVVRGKVVSISQDLLTDPQTGISYYLARVAVTAEGLQKLGDRKLQPGMPVEVIVKTGERSVLTYLLSPLTKRIAASMTEE